MPVNHGSGSSTLSIRAQHGFDFVVTIPFPWRGSKVVMQRPAKPFTPVRSRPPPPHSRAWLISSQALFVSCCLARRAIPLEMLDLQQTIRKPVESVCPWPYPMEGFGATDILPYSRVRLGTGKPDQSAMIAAVAMLPPAPIHPFMMNDDC